MEFRTSVGSSAVGTLDYSSDFVQTISTADQAFASLVREGAFVNERKVEFEVFHYLDSFADWEAFMETEAQYYVPPDRALIESVQGLLDGSAGEIVLSILVEATRFRRSG